MHSLQAQAFFQVILNNGIGLAPFTDDVSRGGAERFPEWEIPASPISKLGISDAAVVLHHLTPKCGNYFIYVPILTQVLNLCENEPKPLVRPRHREYTAKAIFWGHLKLQDRTTTFSWVKFT